MVGDIYLWGMHSFKFSGHFSLQLLYLFMHRGWSQILLFGETDLFWTVSILTLIIICCEWYTCYFEKTDDLYFIKTLQHTNIYGYMCAIIIKVVVIHLKLKFIFLKLTSKLCCMNYFDCNVTQSWMHLYVSAILGAARATFIWLEAENRFWSNPTHRCPSTKHFVLQ